MLGTVAVGALLTTARGLDYLGGATARFLGNLALLQPGFSLIGVRRGAELCNVNGSPWTLPWEARSYMLLAVLFAVGRRAVTRLVLPATPVCAILWDVPAVAAVAEAVADHGAAHMIG